MPMKHVKYKEGQWFAVPLRDSGYALGIIVRGSYKTKGGLGYFFGRRFQKLPNEEDTCSLYPNDVILIAWFGDLGIIRGKWPLVMTTKDFRREDWSIPLFRRDATPDKGWLIEYDQDAMGFDGIIQETLHDATDLEGLPADGTYGASAVEEVLTKLLEYQRFNWTSGC